ncbi:MAG: argininosuccinate synthase [Synergistaceae bacterium]|jgi:argininosuccinate synthase|nr:argininosuccinate synthase [Synergistaceae bacterium]
MAVKKAAKAKKTAEATAAHAVKTGHKGKVVLAYSGGLDTSVAIPWLMEQGYDVVTMTADVGQQADNMPEINEKAVKTGAVSAHMLDLREEMIENYIWPGLKANALYEGVYPLNSAYSRPLIAQALIYIAQAEGAVAIAHGCTGKGQDQVRIEVCANALDPSIEVLAPVRDWHMTREQEMEYAERHKVPVPITRQSPYSLDDNLWGRSCECGVLEDPWNKPPKDAYGLTVDPLEAPDKPAITEITFDKGVPVAVDGKKMKSIKLIGALNKLAGAHGIGRIDMIENRLVGFKSREVYECPAAVTLITAHRALESITISKDVMRVKSDLEKKFSELAYEGYWFSPLMQAIQAFVDSTQESVSGTVRVRLYKGSAVVEGMKSDSAIYRHDLATYSEGDMFDHSASVGFIKVWGLPIKTWTQAHRKGKVVFKSVKDSHLKP